MAHGRLLALLYPLQDALRFGAAIAPFVTELLTLAAAIVLGRNSRLVYR